VRGVIDAAGVNVPTGSDPWSALWWVDSTQVSATPVTVTAQDVIYDSSGNPVSSIRRAGARPLHSASSGVIRTYTFNATISTDCSGDAVFTLGFDQNPSTLVIPAGGYYQTAVVLNFQATDPTGVTPWSIIWGASYTDLTYIYSYGAVAQPGEEVTNIDLSLFQNGVMLPSIIDTNGNVWTQSWDSDFCLQSEM